MNANKVFIIAEAGVNHNGDLETAKQLVDVAVKSGVDAIKFQSFKAENLVTYKAPKAEYQTETTVKGSQFDMLKKLELSIDDHIELKKHCDNKGIMFLSTPFDFASVGLLEKINIPIYKISSGDLTNIPLLKFIARKNKPIILSTGMANLGEIEDAIDAIKSEKNDKISILHCTSNYPTEYNNVNLKAMITMKEAFKLPIGYSDHTIGTEVSIAAVALGAEIIEKHFTLDKEMEGPDHRASLNPEELRNMVLRIRNIEMSLGDGIKKCEKSEENTRLVARKSIVALRDINESTILTERDLAYKRPGDGLPPKLYMNIVGRKASKYISKDEHIDFENTEQV